MEFFNLKPRYDVEDLVLIGNHLFCLGVPYDCVPDFRKYVVAGAIAHHLNLRSIDTALKNYMREKEWKSNPSIDPRLRLITQATALVKKEVVSATDKAIATPTNSEKAGFIAATVALARLPATFRVTVFSLRMGCYLEAAALCRMILEQLAWICNVYEIRGNEWARIKPSACIGNLKEFYPAAGRLYGALSDLTHVNPSTHRSFVVFEGGKLEVVYGDMSITLWATLCLLEVCDLHLLISELIYAEFQNKTTLLKRGRKGKLFPKLGRPMKKEIVRFIKNARASEQKTKSGRSQG